MGRVEELVAHYRQTPIIGALITLRPYGPEHAEAVVDLRNRPEARYFLNQLPPSTLDTQHRWYEGYLTRTNDLMWVIEDRQGMVVGCNRLYDIRDGVAEKGSQIVDAVAGRSAPIALEADLLAIKLAFQALGTDAVVARVRKDNEKVLSMNQRMGFRVVAAEEINGAMFELLRLERAAFAPAPLDQLINYWSRRDERRKA